MQKKRRAENIVRNIQKKETAGRIETGEISPELLDVKNFCRYLSIGQTKARELLHDPANGFTVQIGNRLYADKKQVDKWIQRNIWS